jgi:DNA-binding response OmpR family regulator
VREVAGYSSSPVMVAVHDEVRAQLILAMLLEWNIDAVRAADGASALQIVRTKEPCALVLDIHMARHRTRQVISTIQNIPDTTRPRVLVLTKWGWEPEVLEKTFNLKVDEYLVRPFDPEEFSGRLSRLFRGISDEIYVRGS